jgi:hypothetical protein
MRKTEVEYLIKRLIGWINPQIASVGRGDFMNLSQNSLFKADTSVRPVAETRILG